MSDVGENRGADEIAAIADTFAAGSQQCAFLLSDIHIVEDALHLFFGDDRAERCGTIGWIADPDGLRALRQPLDHFVVNLLVREHTRTG